MKEVFKAAFEAFNETYIEGTSRTEAEARETAQTAWRVGGKAKDKGDYWLRLAGGIVGVWFLLAFGAALLPLEPLEQVLMVLPLLAIFFAWFSQPTLVTVLFSWDKTRGSAATVATIALFQSFAGFVIWLTPLHAERAMALPFVVVLTMIGLSYLALNNKAVRGIRKVLIVIAVIMVFGFWAAEDAATEEPQVQQQGNVNVIYAQPVTTVARTPQPQKVSPAPATATTQELAQPEQHPVSVPGANVAPRRLMQPLDPIHTGEVITFTIELTNHSGTEAVNVVYREALAPGLTYVDTGQTSAKWHISKIGPNETVEIVYQVKLADDASAGSYRISVALEADNQTPYSFKDAFNVIP